MSDSTSNHSVIQIPLTRGHIAIVSLEDANLLDFSWHACVCRQQRYAGRYKGEKRLFMHRIIMEIVLGRALVKGEYVDHINHNGLDNRRDNLRLASAAQNMQNSRLRSDNTSGYKGVVWVISRRKWRAEIYVDKRSKCLGYFQNAIDAAKAYNDAALKYFGEFAFLNTIEI